MSYFPPNPSDGDVFIHPNGREYEFHIESTTWSVIDDGGSGGSGLTTLQANTLNTLSQTSFLILE